MTDAHPPEFVTKVPYEPTVKRRFELSQDPFTKERVTALLSAYRELKRDVPFFAGMTAFGSLTKGKKLNAESARHTDIDLFLFVDRDDYDTSIEEFRKRKDFDSVYRYVAMHEPAALGPADFVEPLNVEKAAGEYLNRRIGSILINLVPQDRRPDHLAEFGAGSFEFISSNSDDPYSIFQWVFDPPSTQPSSDLESNVFIGGPLLFDIGGGLRPYREAFMRKMTTLPKEERDRLWAITVNAMKVWERQGGVDPALEEWYPDKFEDAVAIYKPKAGSASNLPEIV